MIVRKHRNWMAHALLLIRKPIHRAGEARLEAETIVPGCSADRSGHRLLRSGANIRVAIGCLPFVPSHLPQENAEHKDSGHRRSKGPIGVILFQPASNNLPTWSPLSTTNIASTKSPRLVIRPPHAPLLRHSGSFNFGLRR